MRIWPTQGDGYSCITTNLILSEIWKSDSIIRKIKESCSLLHKINKQFSQSPDLNNVGWWRVYHRDYFHFIHLKKLICFIFTHCRVVPNQYDFLSSVERYFGEFCLFGILDPIDFHCIEKNIYSEINRNILFCVQQKKINHTDLKCAIPSKTVIFILTQNTSS